MIAALVAICLVASAEASIQLNPVSVNGTASVAFEGSATFTKTGLPAFGPTPLVATIIEKTFGFGTTNIVFDDVTYTGSDLDAIGGPPNGNLFRWAERIFNNTGNVWTDFTLTLSETTGVFLLGGGFAQPSFVTINGGTPILAGGPNTIVSDDTLVMADVLGTAVLSAGNKVATFTFDTPIASGTFFDLYVPIGQLPNPSTGTASFQLAQAPTQVPETASIAVWVILGLAVGGGVWLRGRMTDSNAARSPA